jgi:uncharacterized repeat protein (TIGR03847 family)
MSPRSQASPGPKTTPRPKTTPPTTVLLVRHGATGTTGKVLPGRAAGLHLSDTGREQAAGVAARLAAWSEAARDNRNRRDGHGSAEPARGITAVYTSPLERTRETAAAIAKALGLRARVERGLLECDFGEWTGGSLKDLAKLPEWSTVQRYPSGFRFPGGESFAGMQARIVDTIARLRSRHAGATVVAVSHADPIKAAVAEAVGTHLDLFQRIVISPSWRCRDGPRHRPRPVRRRPDGPRHRPRPARPCTKGRRPVSRSFELPEVDWATVGTVGEPGQRTFYLQARQADQLVTLKLEKQQVAAMSQFLGEILSDLPAPEEAGNDSTELIEPVLAEWAVGALQLAYDPSADRIVILAEEFSAETEEDEGEQDDDVGLAGDQEELGTGIDEPDLGALAAGMAASGERAVGRIGVTRFQAASIARRGWELVGAGRPTCALCGHPIDPEGHSCPRTNGHGPPGR